MTDQEKSTLIEKLLSDKDTFNEFVYTPWKEALERLASRRSDAALDAILPALLPHGTPDSMKDRPAMVLFRNVASPNYEAFRFMICADVMPGLQPIFFEYTKDKFADINPSKYALARLCFYHGLNKLNKPIVQYRSIIDMDHANGKIIADIQTKNNVSLVGFHHHLLATSFANRNFSTCDISDWLHLHGARAQGYYQPFLSLFIRNGILFENFLFSKDEMWFNRNIILPALIHIRERTGLKPLIVALEPTNIEGSIFWTSYPTTLEGLCTDIKN